MTEEEEARVAAMEDRLAALERRLAIAEGRQVSDRCTLLVFSGEMDNLMAGFIVASSAAAMGMEVTMYFTFWGLVALRKQTVYANKGIAEAMVAAMLPGGPARLASSRLNLGGLGPMFFQHLMAKNHVATLPDLIGVARDLGVRMIACEMSMGVMGIRREELWEGLDYGGAATYLEDAADSRITLFI